MRYLFLYLEIFPQNYMWYHLAVFSILGVETREQLKHESCGTIWMFSRFFVLRLESILCMNHAVPFCYFPDFNVYNEENHINKGCGTVSKFCLFFSPKAQEPCGTIWLFSRFWGLKLESKLCMNHVVPFRHFANFKV